MTANHSSDRNNPFLLWMLNSQDIALKLLALFSISFLLFTSVFMYHELSSISIRNRTYLEILQAEREQDYLAVILKAEKFLNNSSFKGKDLRESEIRQLYAQAFVQWISKKGDQLDDKDWKIINRYQRLNSSK